MHLSLVRLSKRANLRAWMRSFEGGAVTLHDVKNGLKVILMQHDKRRNAITGKMMVEFEQAVSNLEESPPRGVILRGAGGHFCSGWDLSFVERVANPGDGQVLCSFVQDVTRRLQGLPCPSTALVEGFAIGGGAELALSCDWRVMSARAHLEFRQARMGVTTGNGGCLRLMLLVGRPRALQILLGGRRFDGEAALRTGLADHVIPEKCEDPLTETAEWLQSLYGDVDTKVVHAMKRAIHAVDALNNNPDLLEAETQVFASMWGGPVQQEILRKVREAMDKKK